MKSSESIYSVQYTEYENVFYFQSCSSGENHELNGGPLNYQKKKTVVLVQVDLLHTFSVEPQVDCNVSEKVIGGQGHCGT